MGERIDKRHRFPIRIDPVIHNEIQALSFSHQISLNNLYNEMILFSLKNKTFMEFLKREYPVDERRGHFIYVQNGR